MYLLDTNSIYYLSEEKRVNKVEFDTLLKKAKNIDIYYSPINVIELITRVFSNPTIFKNIKEIVKKFLSLNPKLLVDPETQMYNYINQNYNTNENANNFSDMMRGLSKAENIKKLQYGYPDIHEGYIKTKKIRINEIDRERKIYEKNYIKDMKLVLKSVSENFNSKYGFKNNKIKLSNDDYSLFEQFLESNIWDSIFYENIERRVGTKFPNDFQNKSEIISKFTFFKKGYEQLLRHIFKSGYKPQKKNDYNDLHQLIYLNNDNNLKLVTSDSSNPMFTYTLSKNKIITFQGFINKIVNA